MAKIPKIQKALYHHIPKIDQSVLYPFKYFQKIPYPFKFLANIPVSVKILPGPLYYIPTKIPIDTTYFPTQETKSCITLQGCPSVAFSQNFADRFLNNANRGLSCILCKIYMFYIEIQMFNSNDLYGGVIYSNFQYAYELNSHIWIHSKCQYACQRNMYLESLL